MEALSRNWEKMRSNLSVAAKIANRIDSANFIGEDLKFAEDSIESLIACALQLGIALPSQESRVELTVNGQTCFFEEFCSDTFHAIRKTLDVCEVEYRAILGLNPPAASTTVRSTLRFIGTRDASGKSNSWFLFSPDMRLCLKTSNATEAELLQDILSSYASHCADASDTLLPHFYGLYRVTVGRAEFWFIVQKNVFASKRPIVERYDVKGSTHNRRASQRELAKQTHSILKDWDLVSRKRFLCVPGADEKDQLMKVLAADVAWLQRHGLMDYSFLIGYMTNNTEHQSPPQASSGVTSIAAHAAELREGETKLFLKHQPSSYNSERFAIRLLPVVDPNFSAAYVGIIDILTKYGARKRAEHICLGVLANRPGASCQPPQVYASRLLRFVDLIVISMDKRGGGETEVVKLVAERTLQADQWFASHGREGVKENVPAKSRKEPSVVPIE